MRKLFSNNTTALEKFQALIREKYKLNVFSRWDQNHIRLLAARFEDIRNVV